MDITECNLHADLPIDCTLPTVFVSILYWMGGLAFSASAFFETLFTVLLLVLVAQSFGLLVGAVVPMPKTAQVKNPGFTYAQSFDFESVVKALFKSRALQIVQNYAYRFYYNFSSIQLFLKSSAS